MSDKKKDKRVSKNIGIKVTEIIDKSSEEYSTLRTEILDRIKMVTQIQVLTVTTFGLIWGWAHTAIPENSYDSVGIAVAFLIFCLASMSSFEVR